ncbi:MAG TPA: DNA-binding domain-containing protein, partial [Rhizobiaceae bacterium]|nr:DNA-binding domain-containing protein [Rhizobiaceae bacterium]
MTPQPDMPADIPLNTRFAAALLDPRQTRPVEVTAHSGKRAEKRFDVYRNNVTFSLMRALADIFPAVKRIVGDRAFDEDARAYV